MTLTYTNARSMALAAVMLLALTGCDKLVDTSDAAAGVTKKAIADSRETWRDAFTYHPKPAPQLAQTRYGYQVQTDVTCYDSVQPNQTAKLLGYQDGENVSWFQPGGGSTGASGGDPVSYRNNQQVSSNTQYVAPSLAVPTPPVTVSTIEVPQTGSIRATNLPPAPIR